MKLRAVSLNSSLGNRRRREFVEGVELEDFLIAAEKKDMLAYPLLKQFPIKINLEKLNQNEVISAIKQRIDLLGWKISSENLISKIAQCGEIGQAMETLSIIYMVMRGKNQDQITEEHVATALSLVSQNILSNLKML